MTESETSSTASLLDWDTVVLLDQDEEPCTEKHILGDVQKDRRSVWMSRIAEDDLKDNDRVMAVKCTGGRGVLEHAVRIRNNAAKALMLECKVSFEELPPSALVEYQFKDSDEWRLSMVCLDYLLAFRAGKFKDWEQRLLQPTCLAELRRMVSIGAVFQVYDHHMFPSPENEKAQFEVKDENSGKTVVLPRPVSALRIWNVDKQAYDEVDPTLEGAPPVAERDAYWKGLLQKLAQNFPDEAESLGVAESK